MKAFLLTFAIAITQISAVSVTNLYQAEWEEFKLQHGKQYNDLEEETYRLEIYLENSNFITQHNQRYNLGLETFDMALNKFGDMDHDEFLENYTGLQMPQKHGTSQKHHDALLNIEYLKANVSVDWRQLGAITSVKSQGGCGSCWAFATTGVLEAHTFIKTNKLVELSEQNLIDCSKSYNNHGCKGGLMTNAFKYIRDNDGIDTETEYPYEGQDKAACRYTVENKGAIVTDFVELTNKEDDMKNVISSIGPVAVGIQVTTKFQFYKSGVFSDKACKNRVNHAVVVVGYGTNENDEDYWIVKNSWGTIWGLKGFINVSRDNKINCGITTMASYPIV